MAQRCSGTKCPLPCVHQSAANSADSLACTAPAAFRLGSTRTASQLQVFQEGLSSLLKQFAWKECLLPCKPSDHWRAGEVARPRPRILCAVQEQPYCGQNAQTQAARTHRSLEVDFESTALTAWQRMHIGCTRSHCTFSFSNGPFTQNTVLAEHRATGDPVHGGTHTAAAVYTVLAEHRATGEPAHGGTHTAASAYTVLAAHRTGDLTGSEISEQQPT